MISFSTGWARSKKLTGWPGERPTRAEREPPIVVGRSITKQCFSRFSGQGPISGKGGCGVARIARSPMFFAVFEAEAHFRQGEGGSHVTHADSNSNVNLANPLRCPFYQWVQSCAVVIVGRLRLSVRGSARTANAKPRAAIAPRRRRAAQGSGRRRLVARADGDRRESRRPARIDRLRVSTGRS